MIITILKRCHHLNVCSGSEVESHSSRKFLLHTVKVAVNALLNCGEGATVAALDLIMQDVD